MSTVNVHPSAGDAVPNAPSAPFDLQASTYSIAIVPSFIAQRTVKINMFEKIKDERDIFDLATNQPILKIAKESSLFHATKNVLDAQGRLLFRVKERQSTDDTQLYLTDPDGERFLWAGKVEKGCILAKFKNHAEGPGKGVEETLYVRKLAHWRQDGSVYIKNRRTGENVALVRRDGVHYQVAVAANVDISLIVAICVAFDYKAKQDKDDGDGSDDENDDTEVSDVLDAIQAGMQLFGISS